MILTEAQARGKWCRHRMSPIIESRLGTERVIPGTVANSLKGEGPKCIASDCMAWRTDGHKGFCGADPVPPIEASQALINADCITETENG